MCYYATSSPLVTASIAIRSTRTIKGKWKRKRIDVSRVSTLPDLSIPCKFPNVASYKLLLAICILLGKCDALQIRQSHRNIQRVVSKFTLKYAIRSEPEKFVTNKKSYLLYPRYSIGLMSTRSENVESDGRTESQNDLKKDDVGGRVTGDFSVIGRSSDDSSSYKFPQQTRNRLADRIRQLHQQQQDKGDGVASSSSSTTTMSVNVAGSEVALYPNDSTDDSNELYLQVKQGIVQIKSKEQHSYVSKQRPTLVLAMCDGVSHAYFSSLIYSC